jgi:2-C-methyl-D-erythritol 2,4-cyclodiphosphate synthase
MIRTGIGYDAHQLAKDEKLIIANIEIPSDKGSVGHSDGDTLTHAIIDALLGAAALGDLGDYFPSYDNKWKGVSSLDLLRDTVKKLESENYNINNVDGVIIMQKPKIKKYILQIRKKLADALNISLDNVSVKATTVDKLGVIGNSEGWAAQAVVTLSK